MAPSLHIVAACADKKRHPPDRAARLRTHRGNSIVERVASFTAALTKAGPQLPARDLYVGPYWATVRSLPDLASGAGLAARLWVASAGYGLVSADSLVCPYSATFQVGHPDSVADARSHTPVAEQLCAWWAELSRKRNSLHDEPNTVQELADSGRSVTVLVIVSPRYLQAMRRDLECAASTLRDRLIVVSSQRMDKHDPLYGNVVVSEARLTNLVGGALPSLHARVAGRILREAMSHGLTASALRTRYEHLVAATPPVRSYDRTPLSDAQVIQFIKRQTELDASPLSHTGLLRRLRSMGRACEQKRFKRLFEEVQRR